MRTWSILSAVLLLVAGAAAQAEVLTVSASVSGLTDFISTAELPQFDPSLGTLQSVDLSVDAWLVGTYTFTNQSATITKSTKVYFDWVMGVNSFGAAWNNLPPDQSWNPWWPVSANVLYYPWGDPPTEANGWTPANNANSHFYLPRTNVAPLTTMSWPYGGHQYSNNTYTPSDNPFIFFSGMGTLPFDVEIPCFVQQFTYGQGSSTWSLSTTAGVTVTASYNYIVPEPATLVLLGLSALCILRRR